MYINTISWDWDQGYDPNAHIAFKVSELYHERREALSLPIYIYYHAL